jgi:hypothetical protein
MTKYTLAIVGAKFSPPAQGILSVLPTNAALVVRREPSNAYDENAMQVLAPTDDWANAPGVAKLDEACAGYGHSGDDVLAKPEWHLGYIPRQDALLLAPRMDKAEVREVPGVLTWSAEGAPRVQFEVAEG